MVKISPCVSKVLPPAWWRASPGRLRLKAVHPLPGWPSLGNNSESHAKKESMADQELHYYPNEFEPKPNTRPWWPKVIAICAVLGGIYGAAIGAILNSTPGATKVIGTAAAIMAIMFAMPGARFGFFFGMVNHMRFGKSFVGSATAICGALLGGFFGIVALMPLGAILGAFVGWFLVRAVIVLRRGRIKRFLGGVIGAVLGAFFGATVLAVRLQEAPALLGMAWGLGIGAVSGALLLPLFFGVLNSLPRWREY